MTQCHFFFLGISFCFVASRKAAMIGITNAAAEGSMKTRMKTRIHRVLHI